MCLPGHISPYDETRREELHADNTRYRKCAFFSLPSYQHRVPLKQFRGRRLKTQWGDPTNEVTIEKGPSW